MKTNWGKRGKLVSLSVLLLAILFYIFFDKCKHVPSLAEINPFAVDPFDAVGSFGIQFAIFASFLSLIRVFRPRINDESNADRERLILHGEIITILSIAVTLGADIIAMLRRVSLWIKSPAGITLEAMVGGMAVLTALATWLIFRYSNSHLGRGSWRPGVIIFPIAILTLASYPALWVEGIIGGIAAALLGMVLFIVTVWAFSIGISSKIDHEYVDFIDDLGAVYDWIRVRAVFASWIFHRAEKFMDRGWVQSALGWLDPRKHTWNLVILGATAMGVALAFVEAIGEGVSPIPGRFIIVVSVFIGIEGSGIMLGYTLLAPFLGIYRSIKSV